MGRRSPSRAGLLNGSSSMSSTTTIVRVALIGKQKKVYTSSDVLFFYEKKQKKIYTSSDVLFCTENIGEAVL